MKMRNTSKLRAALREQIAKLMNHGLNDDEIADRVTDGGFKHPVSPIFIGVIRDVMNECDRCSVKNENQRMTDLLYADRMLLQKKARLLSKVRHKLAKRRAKRHALKRRRFLLRRKKGV